jgi:selenide,water dikinase
MGPSALAQVLRPLQTLFQAEDYPDLLVGLAVSDDAAVYSLTDEVAVVQTLDFFPPVVDDPYDYGAVAAANAMSDIYAMGGEVLLALNICGFPNELPWEIISEILRGGGEKVAEAGGVLAGGHTLEDKEPKYGLSVTGVVHPARILTKGGALPGDALVLTKPLGVGIVTTALKSEVADPAHVSGAVNSMKRLNRRAAQLIRQVDVHACTDITGFALLGHGYEMAERSRVGLRFYLDRLPFVDGAIQYAARWLFPGGTCRNEEAYEHGVHFGPGVSDEMQQLLYTPETSGGLLVAISEGAVATLRSAFATAGEDLWVIGEVVAGTGIEVVG